MKLLRKVGATSEIWQIFIADSSSTTGAGLTGLTNATSGLTAYYHRDTDTTATAISLVTMTVGTFTSSGFKEIDATNMPGWYQFCPPNAALASGAKSCGFHLKGATNMAPLPIEVDLDGQVDVTTWNGTAVSSPATAGIPDVNVKNMNNVAATSITTINANQGTTQPVNFTGTAGSAYVKSDVIDWSGTAVATPNTAGVPVVDTRLVARTGTAQATGNTTTAIKLDASASATTDFYKYMRVTVISGTGSPQSAICTAYNGSTKVATVSPAWPTAPDNTSVFVVSMDAQSELETILGTASVGAAGYVGLDWGHINAPTTTVNLSGTTIATVTNQLTAAAIATGVWQDTTSGDFTVASSIGKSLYTNGAVPGAAGGLFIAGTNAATTVTTSFTTTFTGNLTGNVGGSVASVTARVTANADQINGDSTAASNQAKAADVVCTGTATTGGSTTSVPTSAFSPAGAVADQFKGRVLIFDRATTTAALRGQVCSITASSNSATPTFTVTTLTTAPASGDTFVVL